MLRGIYVEQVSKLNCSETLPALSTTAFAPTMIPLVMAVSVLTTSVATSVVKPTVRTTLFVESSAEDVFDFRERRAGGMRVYAVVLVRCFPYGF